jgi:hypothetical protein
MGISLHQVTFVWLAFAGTLNLLTHYAVIISSNRIMYIFHLLHHLILCEEIVIINLSETSV